MMITQRKLKMQAKNLFNQKIGLLLSQIGMLSRVFAIQSFSRNGLEITPEQFTVLAALVEHGGLYQRQVCAITLKDRANITRIVSILESQGLVIRRIESQGRQIRKAEITDKGREVYEKALPAILEIWAKTVEDIDEDEMNACFLTLQKIKENLQNNTTLNL